MAARKHAPAGGGFTVKALDAVKTLESKKPQARKAAKPAAEPVDVQALFDSTMKRYPRTMARLAE